MTVAAAPPNSTSGSAQTETGSFAPVRVPGPEACPLCGAPLNPDQDWCLECGAAATTRILRPPSWKLAAACFLLTAGSGSGHSAVVFAATTAFGLSFYAVFGLVPAYIGQVFTEGAAALVFAFGNIALGLGGVLGNILGGRLKEASGSFTAIYFVMPVGRLSFRHALIGGATATVLWEMMRHMLAWYYTTMSQIQVVYGSLTTAIAVLLSVEIGALVLLVGAQVIAEYERIGREPIETSGRLLKTEKAR